MEKKNDILAKFVCFFQTIFSVVPNLREAESACGETFFPLFF
jgi:hypothetical protein